MLHRVSALIVGLLVASALPGWLVPDSSAQALNVGYTDHEIIIVNMPEYQEVQETLQSAYQGSQQELQTLSQDFQDRLAQYQQQQSLLSQERRQEREQELMELQQQLQTQAQEQEQELAQRESELMQPILEKVQTAINEVAAARGLDLVIRSQLGAQPLLLYVNDETIEDITLPVARNLGLEVDAEETQATEPN